jgi:hypothetical protein
MKTMVEKNHCLSSLLSTILFAMPAAVFLLSVPYSQLKQLAAILLLVIFLFVSIIMPYGNFNDNYATRLLYNQQQREDPDLNISEFIFEKLLCFGELFEDEDDDDEPEDMPLNDPQPVQSLQLQAGFLECNKPVIKMQELPETPVKPTCVFKENKFSREFSSAVFHPPAAIS